MRMPLLLPFSLAAAACVAGPPEPGTDAPSVPGSPEAAGVQRPVRAELRVPRGAVEVGPADLATACDAPDGYAELDLTDLLGAPAAWDGAKVAALGPHGMTYLFTAMECPPNAACCNRQLDTHFLIGPADAGNGVEDTVYLKGIGCSDPARAGTCPCLEVVPFGPMLVWGTAHVEDGRVEIQVDGRCRPGPSPRDLGLHVRP